MRKEKDEGWQLHFMNTIQYQQSIMRNAGSFAVNKLPVHSLILLEGNYDQKLIFISDSSDVGEDIRWQSMHGGYLLSVTLPAQALPIWQYLWQQYGQAIKADIDATDRLVCFRFIVDMCHYAGVPHHYTPEAVFAYEFSEHYDQIAEYFPEFARLKALSELALYTQAIRPQYVSLKEEYKRLKDLLESGQHWQTREQEIKNKFIEQVKPRLQPLQQLLDKCRIEFNRFKHEKYWAINEKELSIRELFINWKRGNRLHNSYRPELTRKLIDSIVKDFFPFAKDYSDTKDTYRSVRDTRNFIRMYFLHDEHRSSNKVLCYDLDAMLKFIQRAFAIKSLYPEFHRILPSDINVDEQAFYEFFG